jgi:methyl halide transferase
MSELVKRNGFLVTLIYPMDGPREDGPPFSVNVGMYEEALGLGLIRSSNVGETVAESTGAEWEKLVDKVPEKSSESHKGRERLVIWRRV